MSREDYLWICGGLQVVIYGLLAAIVMMGLGGCGQLDTIMPDLDYGWGQYGLQERPVIVEVPTVNLPLELRQENWGSGSCTWASMITLLRWQGEHDMAEWVRANYSGGELSSTYAAKLNAAGIRFAQITNGDVAFLEWACDTRRGAGITVKGGAHMVTLAYLDGEVAILLDNNSVGEYITVPRDELIREWQNSHGWATTPIYSPYPPLPQ